MLRTVCSQVPIPLICQCSITPLSPAAGRAKLSWPAAFGTSASDQTGGFRPPPHSLNDRSTGRARFIKFSF
jgi:hypothetical protein